MTAADDEFQRVVTEGLLPQMEGSHVCVTIVPRSGADGIDAKFCVELGAMIMLDKPILAIVHPDLEVPQKLKLVADEILRADISTEYERIATVAQEFAERVTSGKY